MRQRDQQHPQATSQMRRLLIREEVDLEEDEHNPVCQPLFVIIKRFSFDCLARVRSKRLKKQTLMEAITGNTKPTRSLKNNQRVDMEREVEKEKCKVIHNNI